MVQDPRHLGRARGRLCAPGASLAPGAKPQGATGRRRPAQVALAGGVFAAHDDAFETRISEGVRLVAPRATVRRPDAPPVLGAALLGLDRLLGGDTRRHAAAVQRLRASLGVWRP